MTVIVYFNSVLCVFYRIKKTYKITYLYRYLRVYKKIMSESLKYNQRQNKKNLHTGIYMSCGNRISKDSTPWYWLWSRTYRGGGESDKDVTAIE